MIVELRHNAGDAITGERILPGERALDTGYPVTFPFELRETSTRFIKEATIVWLAEQAGYDVVKRDAGDSRDAENVDATDVGSGDGEGSSGKAKARGRTAAKRGASGSVKD